MRILLLALLALPQVAAADDSSKYYEEVRGVTEADGVSSGITDELKKLFEAELARHKEFTLERPAGLPTEPEAMVAELKKRKLKAFQLVLKVLAVTRKVEPPPPGKQYQVLTRGIKLSVLGDTIPEKIMAIGGDGEAQIGAEVGKQQDLEVEGKKLLAEAAKDALKQAVDMTVTKLALAGKTVKLKKKKK